LKDKGQAAIEFLLIFIAVFAVISSFMYPRLTQSGKTEALEGRDLLNANNAAEGIASRINRIAPGGESGKDPFRVTFYQEWKMVLGNGELLIDSEGLEENLVADLDYSFHKEKEIEPGSYWVEVLKTKEEEDNVIVENDKILITINPWGENN